MATSEVLKRRNRQSEMIRKMVVAGMLSAVTAVLVFTPIGMIPLPFISATTVHVPVLIGMIVEGPWVGLVVGLVFGCCSWLRALQGGTGLLTPFFQNPLVSVLPRLVFPLVGFLTYWIWKKIPTKSATLDKVGVALASGVGALMNTVLVLLAINLLYNADLTAMLNEMISAGNAEAGYLNNAGAWIVAAVGVPNGIGEAIVAAVIVPMIKVAVDAVTRRGRRAPGKAAAPRNGGPEGT